MKKTLLTTTSSPHCFIDKKNTQLSNTDRLSLSYILFVSVLSLAFVIPDAAYAHRGAVDAVDECKIRVGFEAVHFTAYTPTLTGAKEYCNKIPQLGPTNFVFDYEGKKLRHLTVEFEITKEPEGTRIFYQPPTKVKTGNFNGMIDFSKYGAGDYLAHVALVHKEKKLDTHLPFKVGFEERSYGRMIGITLTLTVLAVVLFLMWRQSKKSNPVTESPSTDD